MIHSMPSALIVLLGGALLLQTAEHLHGVDALRIAFLADAGTGYSSPARPYVDFAGELQNVYNLNGEPCVDYKGDYCLLGSWSAEVFSMLKQNDVDLVIHAGDLDYESSPRIWHNFLSEHLKGMDYLATKGNHDANCDEGSSDAHGCSENNNKDSWQGGLWDGRQGYATYLRRHQPKDARCYGTYGTDYACNYKGIFFVFSSVGVETPGESANRRHADFIRKALARSQSQWKICVWHMTQAEMQVSYKGSATGWEVYEICREYGAFIVTGHAHAYSRTYEMKQFAKKNYNHYRKEIQVGAWDYNKINLRDGGPDKGRTAVAVVGTGGYKNEPQKRTGRHWAKIYAAECKQPECFEAESDGTSRFGALLCDFHQGGKNWANCQFKVAASSEWKVDEFTLVTQLTNPVKDSLVLDDIPPYKKDGQWC